VLKTVNELAVIYCRMEKGTATMEEQQEFDITIKTSCLDEAFLMNLIKEKAKTIE